MVATNAFGMGIDKSNIRYVLHYNMPQSLEYYYQEAGRAGRDGEEAECVLFFSKQDIIINKNLLQNKSSSFEGADYSLKMADNQRKLNRMIDYCETDECLRGFILSYFGDSSPCMCKKCSNCVVVEDEEEEIYIQSGKRRKKESRISGLSEVGQELFEKLRDCRTKLASDESVPPFIICSDKTLKDMCIKCPGNLLQMADIYGMGEKKIQSYGEDFIKVIKEFVAEKQILDAGTTSTVESDPMLKKSKEKLPFYIEPEKLDMIELKDQCNVSDLTKSINALCEENKERKNLTARFVNELLVNEGYLEEISDGGKKGKHVTKKGKNIGMEEEEREADDNRTIEKVLFK